MEDSFNDEALVIAVKELKEMLLNETEIKVEDCDLESDLELAFFVIGWKYDLKKAMVTIGNSRRLRNSSEKFRVARRNIRSGSIISSKDFPHREIVNKYWEHDHTNTGIHTKDMMPVAVCRVGEVDLYGMQENVPVANFQEYMIYAFEYRLYMLENIWKKKSDLKFLPRFVDIHCLNCPRGFLSTFSYSNIQYFRWWMGVLGPAYPEQCSHVILVNTPWLFYGGWNITKSWLPTRTVDKIEILGSDTVAWKGESLISKIGTDCVDKIIEYLSREDDGLNKKKKKENTFETK